MLQTGTTYCKLPLIIIEPAMLSGGSALFETARYVGIAMDGINIACRVRKRMCMFTFMLNGFIAISNVIMTGRAIQFVSVFS